MTPTTGEQEADHADIGLLRGVRRNLVLWSGGTTLVILLVLGVALYLAAANSLASSSQTQLETAMGPLRAIVTGERPDPGDESPYDFDFASGTFAIVVDADGRPIGRPRFRLPDGLPQVDAISAARANGRDRRTAILGTIPVRILSESVTGPRGQVFVIQVVQDRTAEQRTLDLMLVVLGVGGVAVLLVAFGFGTLYARRALVPIRTSLINQRLALRRQRDFAADASHELRTPLTVVRSSVEHLARHRDEPVGAIGSALDDIDDEVRHMTSIVEDLLLLARSDSGAIALERLPVDLGDVAADGASALAKTAEDRGVTIEVDPQPSGRPGRLGSTSPARGDPGRQRHPAQPGRWADRRHGPGRCCRCDHHRGRRRARHPAGGPTAGSSSASIGPLAHLGAGRALVWRSPPGSSNGTVVGSTSTTDRVAEPGSLCDFRRPWVREGRLSAPDRRAGSGPSWRRSRTHRRVALAR